MILGTAIRWLHAAGALSLVGAFSVLVLVAYPAARAAGRDAPARCAGLDRRLLRFAAGALALTLLGAGLDLWRQIGVATGVGGTAALDPARVGAVLADTRYGTVWLARIALLGLLAALLLLADRRAASDPDWLALRGEGLALAGASLALGAAAGHAAAAEAGMTAIVVDGVHLLATGVWAGALVPLALCLGWTRTLPVAEARVARAVVAARFSRLGLVAVSLLAASGVFTAVQEVGGIPGLLGTPYGRWLCLKLVLFAGLLGVAARNFLVWRRRLAADATAPDGGGEAARHLRRNVWLEVILVAGVLAVVAVLGITTPARHAEVTWPLSFRFDWQATKALPGVQPRVAIGSQLATLGLVALLVALVARPRRWRVASAAGGAAIALGAAVALPPLSVDANPTTYVRPAAPYAAASIVHGEGIYRAHCQVCHGVAGWGDGPAAAGLPRRPADLTAKHAGDHTAGDLFWWLTHGIPGSGMPGFAAQLSPEDRWDVINFVRVLGAAERARTLGPVASGEAAVVAPDFSFTTGVGEGQALRDRRGRRQVLLVFFTLPGSTDRLVRLNEASIALRLRGTEIIGVPLADEAHVYRALGGRPVFFPIAIDGAAEAAATYRQFRRDLSAEGQRPEPPPAAHLELLVDRQGYLRARWLPRDVRQDAGGWADLDALLSQVDRLAREVPAAPIAAEHVH